MRSAPIRKLVLVLSCVGPLALTTSLVGAQPAGGTSADLETDRARALHNEANALFQKGDYARARVAYLAAWNLKKHWQLAGSLGDTERRLGMFRDAAEHLAIAHRTMPATDPGRADVAKWLAEVKRQVATLIVSDTDAGAEVVVDGAAAGRTPLADPIFLAPGKHSIEIAKTGFASDSRKLTVAPGSEQTISVALKKPDTGSAPTPPLPPGGTEPPVEGDHGLPVWPAFVVGGAAVVATAVGFGFVIAANGASSDADALRSEVNSTGCPGHPRCDELLGFAEDVDSQTNAAVGLLVAGGALAAGAIVYGIIAATDGTPASSRSALAPGFAIVPDGRGAITYAGALRGSF